jgi:F0F1-type ATP synthase assembly protein I
MVLGLVLTCYVGSLADERWETGNTFLIIGFFLGLAHAVWAVRRALEQIKAEAAKAEAKRKAARRKYHEDRS